MFNALKDEYSVRGVAADEDTLFRIQGQICGYAYGDMFEKGYQPIEGTMNADWITRRDGLVSFEFTWKCEEWKTNS